MSLASDVPTTRSSTLPTVVAITGATGSVLGFALVKALLELNESVELIISGKSYQVIFEEMGLPLPKNSDTQKTEILNYLGIDVSRYGHLLTCYQNNQLGAPSASGSYLTRGMVVIPCSMATLGKMAAGISDNLVARAADVTLKERRPLIIVPRESPFNRIHLENMLRLDATGALILPPVLSFYQPVFQSIEGQISYTVGKVLDHLGLTQHDAFPRWGVQSTEYALPTA